MGEIVSYKSRGTTMWRSSTPSYEEPHGDFSEIAANGNYRFGLESVREDDGSFSEWRSVGNQVFHRNSNKDWEEAVEPLSEPSVVSASKYFLRMLDSEGIQLRSTNERTEDRTLVYRLEFTEQQDGPVRDGFQITTMTTTVLVSQESFRVVAVLRDKQDEIYFATTASEIKPDTYSRWTEGITTTHYYDYNEPVVIEVPDEYVPWHEGAVLSSALAP